VAYQLGLEVCVLQSNTVCHGPKASKSW